jgi:hypothetical protein
MFKKNTISPLVVSATSFEFDPYPTHGRSHQSATCSGKNRFCQVTEPPIRFVRLPMAPICWVQCCHVSSTSWRRWIPNIPRLNSRRMDFAPSRDHDTISWGAHSIGWPQFELLHKSQEYLEPQRSQKERLPRPCGFDFNGLVYRKSYRKIWFSQ